jgi:hypothetical protein
MHRINADSRNLNHLGYSLDESYQCQYISQPNVRDSESELKPTSLKQRHTLATFILPTFCGVVLIFILTSTA